MQPVSLHFQHRRQTIIFAEGRVLRAHPFHSIPGEIGNAGLHLTPLASLEVVVIHVRKSILELKHNRFPYDADAIDRIDQRLRLRLQYVPD